MLVLSPYFRFHLLRSGSCIYFPGDLITYTTFISSLLSVALGTYIYSSPLQYRLYGYWIQPVMQAVSLQSMGTVITG